MDQLLHMRRICQSLIFTLFKNNFPLPFKEKKEEEDNPPIPLLPTLPVRSVFGF